MSHSEETSPSDATVPLSSGADSDASRSSLTRVEAARMRGSTPPAAFAPTDASGERDFLAERLALFARVACLASSGFLLLRQIDAVEAQNPFGTVCIESLVSPTRGE